MFILKNSSDLKSISEICKYTNLLKIDVGLSSISEIPHSIVSLVHLKNLNISHNIIKKIPKEIGALVSL